MRVESSFDWSKARRIAGPCIRPGGRLLTERALEVCCLAPGSRVADIGCGAGGTLERVERAGISCPVGLDSSETLLGEAALRLEPRCLVRGFAEALPFKSGCLDALFSECVLSILTERSMALYECARVLREGGYLVVSDVFARENPGRGEPEAKPARLRDGGLLVKDNLLGFLTTLGFSLLLWEEYQRLLKEFAARMILAGVCLPDLWTCRQGQEKKKTDRSGMSYFLLVARKGGPGANDG